MSRAERERWQLAEERWPALQAFVARELSSTLFGDDADLATRLKEAVAVLPLADQVTLADEYWDWKSYFADRYDDKSFLQDGFGVAGSFPRGDQEGLGRMKRLYDVLAESIRKQSGSDWKPGHFKR